MLWILFQGDYSASSHQLRLALLSLGRPLPTSKMDLAASLMWQLFRQVTHRLYLGKWLFCRAGGIRRKNVEKSDVKNCAKDAAIAYFKLHQMHILGMFFVLKFIWTNELSQRNSELTHFKPASFLWNIDKQCQTWSDSRHFTKCGIWSGSPLLTEVLFKIWIKMKKYYQTALKLEMDSSNW